VPDRSLEVMLEATTGVRLRDSSANRLGLLENIADQRQRLVVEPDHWQSRTDASTPAHRTVTYYGITTIPAYVTSLLRSQVFSYLSVAASYTSMSKPAP